MPAPELWWSETQGLILAEQRYEEVALVRIMTADHSRPLGGRHFPTMPQDAHPMRVVRLATEDDAEVW